MFGLAAIALWVLVIWPDPASCSVVLARFPEADNFEVQATCERLRAVFQERGAKAVCTPVGPETIAGWLVHRNGMIHFGFSDRPVSSIASRHDIRPGDHICIWSP